MTEQAVDARAKVAAIVKMMRDTSASDVLKQYPQDVVRGTFVVVLGAYCASMDLRVKLLDVREAGKFVRFDLAILDEQGQWFIAEST